MRVAIAGAGNVGRSIAAELVENGHEVLLIDKDPHAIKSETLDGVEWLLADACELSSLEEAGLDTCDVAIAGTGDDSVFGYGFLPGILAARDLVGRYEYCHISCRGN